MLGKSDSSSDENEKRLESFVERRGSVASVHSRVEDLNELPDPDAHRSEEERRKMVWLQTLSLLNTNLFHRTRP